MQKSATFVSGTALAGVSLEAELTLFKRVAFLAAVAGVPGELAAEPAVVVLKTVVAVAAIRVT